MATKGYLFNKKTKRWRTSIMILGKRYSLGEYKCEKDAFNVFQEAKATVRRHLMDAIKEVKDTKYLRLLANGVSTKWAKYLTR